jgi:hypothetical protein
MPDWSKLIRSLLVDLQLEAAHEAEIVEELAQHLDDAYKDGLANGLSPQEAERSALAPLRNGTVTANLRSIMTSARPAFPPGRAESRNFLASIWQDLRFGGRLLRLSPVFAVIAILSLALGIGANTAIFQLLDAVRLRSLPVKDPQELVDIRIVDNPYGRTGDFVSSNPQLTNAIWEQLRDKQQTRGTCPDGRCARLQHLRFADGAKRNLLPLYDVWGHKRMLIVATQESGREEEGGAREMR